MLALIKAQGQKKTDASQAKFSTGFKYKVYERQK